MSVAAATAHFHLKRMHASAENTATIVRQPYPELYRLSQLQSSCVSAFCHKVVLVSVCVRAFAQICVCACVFTCKWPNLDGHQRRFPRLRVDAGALGECACLELDVEDDMFQHQLVPGLGPA